MRNSLHFCDGSTSNGELHSLLLPDIKGIDENADAFVPAIIHCAAVLSLLFSADQ